jgi:adenine deaminase
MSVLITATDFHDLMYDYLTRAHQQNILHAEIFFDPQAHTSRGISFATVLTGLRSAILLGQRTLGISASLIMCILRDESANYAMATLTTAIPFKDSIIGIGLDSNEHDNPPSKFSAVYQRASKEGFLLTAHADIDQKDSTEHIRQLLQEIQVDRIDHGTDILSSPDLLQILLIKRIGLTTCPISNSIVSPSSKFPEILTLLREHNALVTINSDDPAYFRGYLNENIMKLAKETDVTRKEIIGLMRNAFGISWISGWKRNHYLQALEAFEKKYVDGYSAVQKNGNKNGGDGTGADASSYVGGVPEPTTGAENITVPPLAS